VPQFYYSVASGNIIFRSITKRLKMASTRSVRYCVLVKEILEAFYKMDPYIVQSVSRIRSNALESFESLDLNSREAGNECDSKFLNLLGEQMLHDVISLVRKKIEMLTLNGIDVVVYAPGSDEVSLPGPSLKVRFEEFCSRGLEIIECPLLDVPAREKKLLENAERFLLCSTSSFLRGGYESNSTRWIHEVLFEFLVMDKDSVIYSRRKSLGDWEGCGGGGSSISPLEVIKLLSDTLAGDHIAVTARTVSLIAGFSQPTVSFRKSDSSMIENSEVENAMTSFRKASSIHASMSS